MNLMPMMRKQTVRRTDFIVTSGISDWALLFKTGTKSEYVMIDVEQNKYK